MAVVDVDQLNSPTLGQDLTTYSRDNGLPPLRPGQFTENLPPDIATSCPAQPEYSEQDLDVEAVHTMAPDADLVYVAADCTSPENDALDAETRIVDHHLADIVSDSWHLGIEQQLPPDLITVFDRQPYQRGIVPAALSTPGGTGAPMRVMSDIAADADPATGMLFGGSVILLPRARVRGTSRRGPAAPASPPR